MEAGRRKIICSTNVAESSVTEGEFLAAIEIDNRGNESAPLVRVASTVKPDWLLDLFPERIEAREEMSWNRKSERVEQVNSTTCLTSPFASLPTG